MLTNEERRDVAARLRDIGEKICYTSLDVLRAIQDACGCNVGLDWEDMEELRDRLADLIEPDPERTCKMELVKSGPIYSVWRFSCCGYEHSENVTDGGATELPGTRCPKCGTVVDDE